MNDFPQELVDLFTDEASTRLARLAHELLQLEELALSESGLALSESALATSEQAVQPSERGLERSERALEPSEQPLATSERRLERSEQVVEPSERGREPSEQAVEPSEQAVEPSERGLERSERALEPSERTARPGGGRPASRAALIDSVFRDAHTLKGSAGMMGLRAFAQVAHRMEDLLEGVRSGTREPTSELIDALLAAVDGLREQLPSVVAGNSDETRLAELEVRLLAAGEEGVPGRPATTRSATTGPAATRTSTPRPPAESPTSVARPVTDGTSTSHAAPPSEAAEAGAAPGVAGGGAGTDSDPATVARPGVGTTTDDGVARVPLARVEEMVRLASEAAAAHRRLVHELHERLGAAVIPRELHALGAAVRELEARAMQARMVRLGTVVEPLRRTVRDVAKSQAKAVRLDVEGEEVELDRNVLDRLSSALVHLVRNAVDHGIETPVDRVQAGKKAQAVLRVSARQRGRGVVVEVSDDGRGIDLDRVRRLVNDPGLTDDEALERLFEPGFSTAEAVTAVSGRGVGLDVVRSVLAPVRGRVEVRTVKGDGTTFLLDVPLTVAAVPSLIVRCDRRQYAVALTSVAATRSPEPDDVPLGAVLDVAVLDATATVVLRDDDGRRGAFSVDEVVAQRDVVVKAVGALAGVPLVAGAAVEADGSVLVVLDVAAVLDRPPTPPEDRKQPAAGTLATADDGNDRAARPRNRVLVADDAAVVREMQRSMLARGGYDVRTAPDGIEALSILREWHADLALVDVEMPGIDGIAFTRAVREDPLLRGTAVLIVTSLGSDEDRRRGMEAGADGYIVKGAYSVAGLLETVARLLGREP